MPGPALLAGSMAIPLDRVDVAALQRACALNYLPMGEEDPLTLHAYTTDDAYIYVPRQLGLQVCKRNAIDVEDTTSPGFPMSFPRTPAPRDYQEDALDILVDTFKDFYDFLFRARTGWGKTIGSLIVAGRLGVTTLVLVDQENLKDQWIDSLVNHFGVDPEDIGLIQGKVCKYEGCPVTIAMVQTLSQKDFPPEVFAYFGFVIVDEVHVIGAPTFGPILAQLPAMYRMGVSATPKRRDGLQKVLDFNLGKVRVYIDDEHPENSVYIAQHASVYSWYANISPKVGRFITEIAEDSSRNLLLAELAVYLYDTGRDALILSDRIEHLRHLMSLCEYLGIPAEDMGVYAGYSPRFGYAKDANPLRRPAGLVKGAEYTPVELQLIAKKVPKAKLKSVKEGARLIFATYGMFSKGVDEKRLNGGIDATPRSQAEQVHGRILRETDGPLRSLWFTIADTKSYRAIHGLVNRLGDYVKNNAVLFEGSLEKGWNECRAKEVKAEYRALETRLKSLRIEPNSVGLHTLVTQHDQVTRAKQHVRGTEKTAPGPRRDSQAGYSARGSSARLTPPTSKNPPSARPSLSRRRQRP